MLLLNRNTILNQSGSFVWISNKQCKTYLCVRSCARASSTSLDTIEIIQKNRDKIMMHKFTAVVMVDYYGENW